MNHMTQKLTITVVIAVLMSAFGMKAAGGNLNVAYVPRELKKGEAAQLQVGGRNVFVVTAPEMANLVKAGAKVHPNGCDTVLEQVITGYSGWIRDNVSADAGINQDQKLNVPVYFENLEIIRRYIKAIAKFSERNEEENTEDRNAFIMRRGKGLGGLEPHELADLLINSWFLKVDNLVPLLGQAFVKLLKQGQELDNFLNNPEYLAKLMTCEGRPLGVTWQDVVGELKKWLARLVLTDLEQNRIRTNLKTTIGIAGVVTNGAISLTGDHLLLSTADEDHFHIRMAAADDGEGIWRTKWRWPIIAAEFCASPFLAILDAKKLFLDDLTKWDVEQSETPKLLAQADDFGADESFSSMAQSKDLSKIAVSLKQRIIIVDLRRKRTAVLKAEGENDVKAEARALCFVPNSPVLVDIRAGGIVRLWNTETEKCLGFADLHGSEITKLHCGQDGMLSTMSVNGVLIRWNCRLAQASVMSLVVKRCDPRITEKVFTLWDKTHYPLCFNENGSNLVIANPAGKGVIFDLLTDSMLTVNLAAPDGEVFVDGVYGQDDLLATLTDKNKIIIWNSREGLLLTTLTGNRPQRPICFSPDGEYLVSGVVDVEAAVLWHYGSKRIAEYIKSELTLEQGLLLLLWLQNECKIPKREHLDRILQSFDKALLRRFLEEKDEGKDFGLDLFGEQSNPAAAAASPAKAPASSSVASVAPVQAAKVSSDDEARARAELHRAIEDRSKKK